MTNDNKLISHFRYNYSTITLVLIIGHVIKLHKLIYVIYTS